MAEEEIIMAPPTFRVVAPKPKMTIYYALLIIALLAMLTACLFMYLEMRRLTSGGPVSWKVSSVGVGEFFQDSHPPSGISLS